MIAYKRKMIITILTSIPFLSWGQGMSSEDVETDTIPLQPFSGRIVGIDVSHHTGVINWEKVKLQGINFAYIKSTEGCDIVDSRFQYNVQKAHLAGIPVGAYHYFSFNLAGKSQAKHFLRNVDVLNMDLPPVIDIEEDDRMNFPQNTKHIASQIYEFIAQIQKTTLRKVVIYANQYAYHKYIEGRFENNPIWICSIGQAPKIASKWHIWQKWHNGLCPGAPRVVDINLFNGDSKEWMEFLTY